MKYSIWRLSILSVLSLLIVSTATAQSAKPWALRDHLSFSGNGVSLDYDVEEGYWRVRRDADDIIADNLAWSVELTDGRIFHPLDLGIAELDREIFDDPVLGAGSYYTSKFPVQDGIQVSNRVAKYNDRPFLAFRITVTNLSDKPVGLKKIVAVSAGAGAIAPLSESVQVRSRKIVSRAGIPLYDAKSLPLGVQFHDPVKDVTFAMGVLPESGRGAPVVDFSPYEGSWMGEIRCDFSPAARIEPGQSIDGDPVGVSFGVPEASHVDMFYSWAYSTMPRPKSTGERPQSWATVSEASGLDELVRTGSAWKSTGVRHALIPAGWESVPGTLSGAAPRYPRNMGSAASTLSQAGLSPGITVDALAVENTKGGGAAEMSDGRSWANPATPQGAASIRANAAKLAKDGFQFFAVAPSMIPDEALEAFGLSRAMADNLGMIALQEGASKVFVLPASAGSVPINRDAWLEAAASVSRIAQYGVCPGPVTLAVEGAVAMDKETAVAISLWPGPIEVMGDPKRDVTKVLGGVLGASRVAGQPVDAGMTSPRQWHAREQKRGMKTEPSHMLLFSGAGPWENAQLEPGTTAPTGTRMAQEGPAAGPAPRATAAASEPEAKEKKRRRRR